jgi:phosphate transport system permease protein
MRRAVDAFVTWSSALVTLAALIALASTLFFTVARGLPALNLAFFTRLPAPVGTPGGGVGNAIVGSVVLVSVALALGTPVGVLGGIYLGELAPRGRVAEILRSANDVLAGVPTIVIGIFAYTTLVVTLHRFNVLAGAVALAIILLPTVVRSTDAALRLVPDEVRDAALCLGVARWRVTLDVALRAAAPGVVTGTLLGLARIAGETAPLLFTAFGNPYWSWSLLRPAAALPLTIFNYAISPYRDWQSQAWGAALVLVALVMLSTLATRYLVARWRRL